MDGAASTHNSNSHRSELNKAKQFHKNRVPDSKNNVNKIVLCRDLMRGIVTVSGWVKRLRKNRLRAGCSFRPTEWMSFGLLTSVRIFYRDCVCDQKMRQNKGLLPLAFSKAAICVACWSRRFSFLSNHPRPIKRPAKFGILKTAYWSANANRTNSRAYWSIFDCKHWC